MKHSKQSSQSIKPCHEFHCIDFSYIYIRDVSSLLLSYFLFPLLSFSMNKEARGEEEDDEWTFMMESNDVQTHEYVYIQYIICKMSRAINWHAMYGRTYYRVEVYNTATFPCDIDDFDIKVYACDVRILFEFSTPPSSCCWMFTQRLSHSDFYSFRFSVETTALYLQSKEIFLVVKNEKWKDFKTNI